MFPNLALGFVVHNAVEVGLEFVHQPILGLPNVLHAATFAGEAI